MSATSPNPNNLVLLAALGIGAYFVMQRRAVAATPVAIGTTVNPGGLSSLINGAVGLVRSLTGGTSSTSAPSVNAPWSTDGGLAANPAGTRYNNPSAFVSGGSDGIAANPVNGAPYDAFSNYFTGA